MVGIVVVTLIDELLGVAVKELLVAFDGHGEVLSAQFEGYLKGIADFHLLFSSVRARKLIHYRI